MIVKQVYELVNNATKEILGETSLLQEDLTNVVDVGRAIFNADLIDNYVKKLVDHIGRVIFVNRQYRGGAPSVLMDGWTYGSVLEKVQAELPEATENETWELEDRVSYDPNIFYKPNVSVKFFNSKTTFEIPMSFTERQVRESFSSAEQLNGFVSMLYNSIEKAMTVKIDALIMKTICNMIAETVHDDFGSDSISSKSGVKAVNLLYMYNQTVGEGETLTASEAIRNEKFIRFATYQMGMYRDRLGKISCLFNVGKKARFTYGDMLHTVLLSEFEKAARIFLYDANGQFKDENLILPDAEVVTYWQGSGTDYAFSSTGTINIKTSANNDVEVTGVLGVMFDRDALGVTNLDRRVTTNYNPKAEFYSNWYKFDAGYFNDLDENCVVFFVA